jgi:hypothetical protein
MFGTKLFKRGSLRIKSRKDADSPPRIIAWYLALRPETVEKTFTYCVIDLKELIVLDGVDSLTTQASESGAMTSMGRCQRS